MFCEYRATFTTSLFMYLHEGFILTQCHDTNVSAPQKALFLSLANPLGHLVISIYRSLYLNEYASEKKAEGSTRNVTEITFLMFPFFFKIFFLQQKKYAEVFIICHLTRIFSCLLVYLVICLFMLSHSENCII